MKHRLLTLMSLSFLLVGTLLLAGCRLDAQDEASAKPANTGASEPIASASTNEVAQPAGETTAAVSSGTNVLPELAATNASLTVPKLSPAAQEVVELAKARVGDEVLLAYIDQSKARYHLTVTDILYLRDLGLSDEVIATMVRHDPTSVAAAAGLANLEEPDATNEVPALAETTAEVPAAQLTAPAAVDAAAAAPAAPEPSAEATSAPATAQAPTQPVTYNYFYNNLSPYGTWMEVPDYGWCWQPTVAVVNVGWQPYCHNGRWVWTDCGWYWNSYYSWGWAPFHYGRWHLSSHHGWLWVPGTHWGPAWVTWRYSPGYCGWAPLPPGAVYVSGTGLWYGGARVSVGFGFGLSAHRYTFVSTRHFYTHHPYRHRAEPTVVNNIYNNTTVINNYGHGSGNTVVNNGIATDVIGSSSPTPIRPVRLRDSNVPDPVRGGPSAIDREGATLAVHRPQLPAQASTPPPEVTRRQQEAAQRSERLAQSDVVKLARENARTSPSRPRPAAASPAPSRTSPTAVSPSRSTQRTLADTPPRSRTVPSEPVRQPAPSAPARNSDTPSVPPVTSTPSPVHSPPGTMRRPTTPSSRAIGPNAAPSAPVRPPEPIRSRPAQPTDVGRPAPAAPNPAPRTPSQPSQSSITPPTSRSLESSRPTAPSPSRIEAPRPAPAPQRAPSPTPTPAPRAAPPNPAPAPTPAPARPAPSRSEPARQLSSASRSPAFAAPAPAASRAVTPARSYSSPAPASRPTPGVSVAPPTRSAPSGSVRSAPAPSFTPSRSTPSSSSRSAAPAGGSPAGSRGSER